MNFEFEEKYTQYEEKIGQKYAEATRVPLYNPRESHGERFPDPASSPREASEQSAALHEDVKKADTTLRRNAQVYLENDRVFAEKLPEAETTLTFSRNLKNGLEEIQSEDDPAIRQTLWEDVLSLRSAYLNPHYIYGATEHIYSGKSAVEDDFTFETLQEAKRDFVVGIFGGVEAAKKATRGFLYDFVNLSFDTIQQEEGERRDVRAIYEDILSIPFVAELNYPQYDEVPAEVWDTLKGSIAVADELVHYDGQSPISPELSERLTSHVDDYLEKAHKYVQWSGDKVEKYKVDALMTDDFIAQKAVENYEKTDNPFLKEAAEHARRNAGLLQSAALAEAALDGVHIKTPSENS